MLSAIQCSLARMSISLGCCWKRLLSPNLRRSCVMQSSCSAHSSGSSVSCSTLPSRILHWRNLLLAPGLDRPASGIGCRQHCLTARKTYSSEQGQKSGLTITDLLTGCSCPSGHFFWVSWSSWLNAESEESQVCNVFTKAVCLRAINLAYFGEERAFQQRGFALGTESRPLWRPVLPIIGSSALWSTPVSRKERTTSYGSAWHREEEKRLRAWGNLWGWRQGCPGSWQSWDLHRCS